MTDARDMDGVDVNVRGAGDDGDLLPGGVTEDFREIGDDDLGAVGTDQTTLGEASGGIDDLDDRLDEDHTPLEDETGGDHPDG